MVRFKDEKEKWSFCSYMTLAINGILYEQKVSGVADNPHACSGMNIRMIEKLITRYENNDSKRTSK